MKGRSRLLIVAAGVALLTTGAAASPPRAACSGTCGGLGQPGDPDQYCQDRGNMWCGNTCWKTVADE